MRLFLFQHGWFFLLWVGSSFLEFLKKEKAEQLRTTQVSPSQNIFWGLGIGIQHNEQGDALWQLDQTLDFQSIVVIYPGQNF